MIVASKKCPSYISTTHPSPDAPEEDNVKITSNDQVERTECKFLRRDDASQGEQNHPQRQSADSTAPLNDAEAAAEPPVSEEEDAFLYYSNDKIRLERLLGRELPHMATPDGPVKRKTRISFEVDPFFGMLASHPELLDESYSDGSEGGDMDIESLLGLR